jgi:N-acetylglutamate synthase-like GNAT family acetyltransferase
VTERLTPRLAKIDDLNPLIELGRLLHRENAMLPWDDDLIRELVTAYVAYTPSEHYREPGMIAVVEENGQLVAMIALRITQLWYSRSPIIEELFNFVHPDHRRSEHAKALIQYAKALADDMQLPLLIGIVSNIRTEAKIRLYQRFLPFAGAFFVYRGDWVNSNSEAA